MTAAEATATRLRDLVSTDPARLLVLPARTQWEVFNCLRGLGDLATAATVLDCLARAHGPLAKVLDAQAQLWPVLGRDEEAIAAARERVERFPSPTGELALARAYLATGQLEEATALAERIRDRAPERPDGWALLGRIALEGGDGETAVEAYEAVSRLVPDNLDARRGLGRAQVALGEEAEATALLADFVARIAPETPPGALLAWAELADDLGDDATASRLRATARTRWVERAVALLPDLAAVASPEQGPAPAEVEPLPDEETEALAPEVLTATREYFGHAGLRPGQARVIAQVLRGADTLAMMPTSAGKSLCYQLPALLLPGVTLVISPLIALMQDQIESLPPAVAEHATIVNSAIGPAENRRRLAAIARGEYKLVYAAPERLRQAPFLRALATGGISLLVIDEAHCISLWGHDFRPDYLIVPRVLPALGEPPVLALTATATPAMVREIGARLGRSLELVRVSLFRPNLHYAVQRLDNKEAKLRATVAICRAETGSGIVYVSSREGCEQVATLLNRELKTRRFDPDLALAYHAGFDPEDRAERMRRFMTGDVRIMVATVAFGMGVDKADVRFIVHFSPPQSLEAYAQESGRAGRDGLPARCVLLYAPADKASLLRRAKADEFDIETLRQVYGQLRRLLGGGWGVVAPDAVTLPAPDDATQRQDLRVALVILERAGLIERHPDAPRTLDVVLQHERALPADDRWPSFLAASGLELAEWRTIDTVAVATALALSPAELEGLLLGWAEETGALAVTTQGRRDLCLRLVLPPPTAAATRLPRLLEEVRHETEARVARMIAYATEQGCRHVALAAHLGERLTPCQTACDRCRAPGEHNPGDQPKAPALAPAPAPNDAALLVLECLKGLPFPVGKTGLTKILLGSIAAPIKADRTRHFGTLAGLTQGKVNSLLDRLIADGLIDRDDGEYRLLSLTPRGRAADAAALSGYAGESTTRLTTGASLVREQGEQGQFDPGDDAPLTGEQEAALRRLKSWRTAQATERAVPPYIIAHDRMLREVVLRQPASHAALLAIKGFGPAKVDTYGDAILAILAGEA